MTSMENKTFQIENNDKKHLLDAIADQRAWGNNKVADLLAEVLEELEA